MGRGYWGFGRWSRFFYLFLLLLFDAVIPRTTPLPTFPRFGGRGLAARVVGILRYCDIALLHIQILHNQRIGLNKLPTRFHIIAHQGRENFIGRNRIFNLHAVQNPHRRIHRGLP